MKSNFAGSCPKCSKTFDAGTEIFISKVGDKWIKCIDKDCFLAQGGKISEGKKPFTPNKPAITEAVKLFQLAEELLKSFKTPRKDADRHSLSINEESIFIMSLFRTLSGNFKPA